MANNFNQAGAVIQHNPGAAVPSGAPRIIGALIGVALTTGANGVESSFAVEGVFTLPKATGFAPTQGAKLIFDSATNTFVASATEGDIVGGAVAWKAAASGDTTIEVRLCPGAGAIEPGGG